MTLGIDDLLYFRLGFRILLNSVLMWNYKCEYFFLYFENYSAATFKI